MTMEYKDVRFDVRALEDTGRIEGYGSVFGNVDGGADVVMPGAFSKSLASGRRVKMLWQHRPDEPIGVWDAFAEDATGLKVSGRLLVSTSKGRDAYELLKAGAIDGLSIGYRTLDSETTRDGIRHLKELELHEVSIVTFPMNESATVSGVKHLEGKGDVERILREAGVPGSFAKLVAIHGFDEAKRILDGRREGDARGEPKRDFSALLREIQSLKGAING